MKIFSDGVYAHSELVNDKWRWVIDEFTDDASTLLFGSTDEVFAIPSADTEEELTAKIETDQYCDNCDKIIPYSEYDENQGLCNTCADMIQ